MLSGHVRKIERRLGPLIRRLANMLSGNYFARIEGRLGRIETALKQAGRGKPSIDRVTRDLYNRKQEETVELFRLALKERGR